MDYGRSLGQLLVEQVGRSRGRIELGEHSAGLALSKQTAAGSLLARLDQPLAHDQTPAVEQGPGHGLPRGCLRTRSTGSSRELDRDERNSCRDPGLQDVQTKLRRYVTACRRWIRTGGRGAHF